jgi:hypothetical protein
VKRTNNYKVAHYEIFSSSVSSFLLGPNISLSTLFSNTLNPRSCINVRDKIYTHIKSENLGFQIALERQNVLKLMVVVTPMKNLHKILTRKYEEKIPLEV